VLQLWWRREWRLAALHTAAYALIGLFWVFWWPILFALQGLPIASAHAAAAGASANALALAFNPIGLDLMAENLMRFVLWQNPLATPLALLGMGLAWKDRNGPLAPLAGGLALGIVFLTVVTPFQGHGWGYRYLHGYLGGFCLLAALAWGELTSAAATPANRSRAWACLAVASIAACAVWLPVRLRQVHDFIQPYARSWSAISHAQADVVVVDPTGLWYAQDLVRNDPFLERTPLVMHRFKLSDAQMRDLCAHYRVAYFNEQSGVAFGVMSLKVPLTGHEKYAGLLSAKPMTPPPCAPRALQPAAGVGGGV
jgi:hypothetical protein